MQKLVADVGLVHGSSFEVVDGAYHMSLSTQRNAEKAAQLLDEELVERVICSGRGPVEGIAYGATEAQLMADYLLGQGISSKQIEIEDASTSAVANWSMSAPIISELHADSVIGITARPYCSRMQLIGDFVASKADFELVGYAASGHKPGTKAYAREIVGRNLIRHFLHANTDTPIESLSEAYEDYKSQLGMNALKKFINRGTAATQPL